MSDLLASRVMDAPALLRELQDREVTIDVALATVRLWLEQLPYEQAAAHVMSFVTGGASVEVPPELAAQLAGQAPPPPPRPA